SALESSLLAPLSAAGEPGGHRELVGHGPATDDGPGGAPRLNQYPAQALVQGLTSAGQCGAPSIDTMPADAGLVDIAIVSDCRAGQAVSLAYSGVVFHKRLDATGKLYFRLDCFAGPAALDISFSDKTKYQIDLQPRDLDHVTKVAITWIEPVDLDLH